MSLTGHRTISLAQSYLKFEPVLWFEIGKILKIFSLTNITMPKNDGKIKKIKDEKKKKNETTNVDICDSPVLQAAPFPLTVKLASGSLVRMGLRHGAPCGKYYSSKNECRKFARPKWLLLLFI